MKTNRLLAGGVAVALVAALVGLAVVAGRDSDGGPVTLPVLGAGGDAENMAADSDLRGGGVEYRAAGDLPALDGEADAWNVPAADLTDDRVAQLAGALGVTGEVRRTEFGWSVGDGTRRLDVQDVSGNPWSVYDELPAETGAVAPELEGRSAAGPPDGPVGDCAADACDAPQFHEPERPADLPTEAEAEGIGRRMLIALGVDLDRAALRVDDAVTLWNVTADPEVGGLPTIGLATSLGIGPQGVVQYGNGWLGELDKGDRYPLIGTAAGIERLGEEQARVMIDPAPGGSVDGDALEPMVVEITGVRLGLQLMSTFERAADGYLVPSYLFTTADGGEIPVIAVLDEHLADAHDGHDHDEEPHGTPAEPGVDGGDDPVPPPTEPSPGEDSCASAGGADLDAVACATTGTVGEPVLLRLTAAGRLRDDCGSPTVEWGEAARGEAVCTIGCESLPPEPIELERTFEHTYDRPGTYTVTVRFHGCREGSGTEQLALPLEVRVEG